MSDDVPTLGDSNLGSLIRRERDRRGMTQLDFANALGVALRTVGTWERTGRIPENRLPAIAAHLDVTIRRLSPDGVTPRVFSLTRSGDPDYAVSDTDSAVFDWLRKAADVDDPDDLEQIYRAVQHAIAREKNEIRARKRE